jgi:hypothetical protein
VNIFGYGETNAGKMFTLFGDENEQGVVQLVLESISKYIESQSADTYLIRTSFFEIINECINDLSHNNKDLQLIEDRNGVVKVKKLREVACNDISGGLELLLKGIKSIKDKAYSNLIYSIVIEPKEREGLEVSKINVIKLCASDYQQKNSIKTKSITALNSIIKNITTSKAIPYKESKLTQYLKNSFDGNTYIVMICNVSHAYTSYEETMSTLSFAMRATQTTLPYKPFNNSISSLKLNVDIKKGESDTVIDKMSHKFSLDSELAEAKILKDAIPDIKDSSSLFSIKDLELESADESKQEELKRVILSSEKNYVCELVFDCAAKIRVLLISLHRK